MSDENAEIVQGQNLAGLSEEAREAMLKALEKQAQRQRDEKAAPKKPKKKRGIKLSDSQGTRDFQPQSQAGFEVPGMPDDSGPDDAWESLPRMAAPAVTPLPAPPPTPEREFAKAKGAMATGETGEIIKKLDEILKLVNEIKDNGTAARFGA